MLVLRLMFAGLLATSLVACGSVSDLSSIDSGLNGAVAKPSMESYQRVVVKEFGSKVEGAEKGSGLFAEAIVSRLKEKGVFREILLEHKNEHVSVTPETLVIDGVITRYEEGNKHLRMLVGMGAGSSYFDADVYVLDGTTGKKLAESKVDLNSWGLGGALAANQTVESFMIQAATKISEDLADIKNASIKPAVGEEKKSAENTEKQAN